MAKRKIVPKLTYCPFCHIAIAAKSKNVIQTEKGLAHYNCTLNLATKELKKVGIPRHKFSGQMEMRKFLRQQAKILFEKGRGPIVEKRLKIVMKVSEEFFGDKIKISKLMA